MIWKNIFVLAFIVGSATAYRVNNPFIVGGEDANIEDHPFIVALLWNNQFSCGASILNSEWILTAAHCVQGDSPQSLSIVHSSTYMSARGPEHVSQVGQVIVHEAYDSSDLVNDIALLKLVTPLESKFSDYWVHLPHNHQPTPTGLPALLLGWGRNETGGSVQNTLQKVNLQIFATEECNNLHSYHIFDSNICAGVPEGGKGQCNGDSGGPLIVHGVQVGVVSWSMKPCTIAPYPGVFTEVSHFIDWIAQHTGIGK